MSDWQGSWHLGFQTWASPYTVWFLHAGISAYYWSGCWHWHLPQSSASHSNSALSCLRVCQGCSTSARSEGGCGLFPHWVVKLSRRALRCGLYTSRRSAIQWTTSRSKGSAARFLQFRVLQWLATSFICSLTANEIERIPSDGNLYRCTVILHQCGLPSAWVLWHGLFSEQSQFPGPGLSAQKLERISPTHSSAAYRTKVSHSPMSPSCASYPLEQV